jgi:hypothetical protein
VLKFDTSVFGGEVPVRLGATDIAVVLPGGYFVDERLFVGNAAIEALGGKDAKFGFRQIKPTAVLWRIVPFEAVWLRPVGRPRKVTPCCGC